MKIVLGTANFNSLYGVSKKKIDKLELKKIINYCLKNNIYYLDTADAYNNYQLIKTFNLKKFKIITKLSNLKKIKKNNLENHIINNLTNLLKNLNVKQLYGLLLHDIRQMHKSKLKVIFQTLKYLKKKKLVKKIGISCYNLKDLNIVKKNKLNIVQFPLNVFDQRLIRYKDIISLKNRKIEIHVRSIFLQGLLLKRAEKIPNYFNFWKKEFLNFEIFSKKLKISKLKLCINFIKQQKLIDMVVIGVEDKKQIQLIHKQFNKKSRKIDYDLFNQIDNKLILPYMWKINEKRKKK